MFIVEPQTTQVYTMYLCNTVPTKWQFSIADCLGGRYEIRKRGKTLSSRRMLIASLMKAYATSITTIAPKL